VGTGIPPRPSDKILEVGVGIFPKKGSDFNQKRQQIKSPFGRFFVI